MKKTGKKVDRGDFNSLPVMGGEKNDLRGNETGKVLRRSSHDYCKQTAAMGVRGGFRVWGRVGAGMINDG